MDRHSIPREDDEDDEGARKDGERRHVHRLIASEKVQWTFARPCLLFCKNSVNLNSSCIGSNPRLHSILLPNITSSLQAITNKIQLLYIVTRFPLEYQRW